MPKKIAVFILITFIAINFIGCGESFRKKFIRKPQHEPKPEEMIISPRDYSKQELPSDELYKMYYAYWKAWHLELMDIFIAGKSKKKIVNCFDQAILNLNRLSELLDNQEKIASLNNYINKLSSLEGEFDTKNIAIVSMGRMRDEARRLFINIQKDFSFSKISKYLK